MTIRPDSISHSYGSFGRAGALQLDMYGAQDSLVASKIGEWNIFFLKHWRKHET